ncbi:hypothetical protein JQ607_23725 [Bradyrhizobium liaoningense]|uniref:hypothetical protein n=1 Tax=Bradyrhizobium liaoningense TaxID=43992 RepID=UPI001BA902BA|nr:hypothetical protein [Bradyrhizobium liaoningense]MBR0843221.1 hypothetical protein [Bradyrhizobium liaoningense]
MTSEAIKALMILALYFVLEITLFYSSIGNFGKRLVRPHIRRTAASELAGRTPEDQGAHS